MSRIGVLSTLISSTGAIRESVPLILSTMIRLRLNSGKQSLLFSLFLLYFAVSQFDRKNVLIERKKILLVFIRQVTVASESSFQFGIGTVIPKPVLLLLIW